ncbi:MAG: prepilin-type N-terminal cleavage/methylation domain-containing protein [Planctomycetes bacterium]|nr:prepilin-type N-terminal cleavage/methylation domain-containing protein [Planctomycetota bacterium]
MKSGKGFTLIELMMVILIVAILASVATPIIRGRIGAAKWTEGKAIMGSIACALRTHIAQEGSGFTPTPTLAQLGYLPTGFHCTYFSSGESGEGNFSWVINDNDPIDFLVTGVAPPGINPYMITLNHAGEYTENPIEEAPEERGRGRGRRR